MKTAIYVRVSTEEQAKEGYSISAQLKKLKAFVVSQGWNVAGIYADEGISAKNMNRPELKRMLGDIQNDKVDVVLVYRLDRLTRSVFDLYKMLEIYDKYDCKFKSATEVYDTTTAMGRMFVTIVAALAQWERENHGERVSMGFKEKVQQGKCPINFAPIGYDLNKDESKLYINHQEAQIVKTIFKKYYDGYGSNKLCRYLNSRKMYTKRGNTWSSDTLFKVIRSPIHAGGIRWRGKVYWDMHEPIISRKFWEKVQEFRKSRRVVHPRVASSPHIFSQLIRCNECGTFLSGSHTSSTLVSGEKKRYLTYRCRYRHYGRCDNPHASYSERQIEDSFIRLLETMDINDDIINNVKIEEIEEPVISIDKTALKRDLKKLEEQKKKWQYAWVENMIDDDDLRLRMEEVSNEKEVIKEMLKDDEVETREYSKKEIESVLYEIRKNWDNLKKHEKKRLLHEVIEDMKIDKENTKIKIKEMNFIY